MEDCFDSGFEDPSCSRQFFLQIFIHVLIHFALVIGLECFGNSKFCHETMHHGVYVFNFEVFWTSIQSLDALQHAIHLRLQSVLWIVRIAPSSNCGVLDEQIEFYVELFEQRKQCLVDCPLDVTHPFWIPNDIAYLSKGILQ